MKKIITLVVLFITILSIKTVHAANYELKELIPEGIKTTIVTKHFSYRQLYYDKTTNKVHFTSIKNIFDTSLPLSVSIALFDEDKKNVGIIHWCDKNNNVGAGVEIPFEIEVTSDYLGEEKTKEDIKYIAIMEDNFTCKTDKSQIYIGQRIDEIGKTYGGQVPDSLKLTMQVVTVVGSILLIIFLYQFMFTNKFKNVDGNEIREVLKNYKNDSARANTVGVDDKHNEMPDGLSIVNKSKTVEMADKEAEENEKSKRKESDLYDMYK